MTLVILIGFGLLVAAVIAASAKARRTEEERPELGRCRRCGRPLAWMHGDMVHTSEAGYYVATEHRPLPYDLHGPHPARGVSLYDEMRGGV